MLHNITLTMELFTCWFSERHLTEAGVKRRPVQIGDLYQCGDLYQLATDQYGDLYQFGDWTGLVALTQDTDTEGGVSVTVMSNKEQKKGENI